MGSALQIITRVWRHRDNSNVVGGRIDYEAVRADGSSTRLFALRGDGLYAVLLTYLDPEPAADYHQESLLS